MKLRNKKTGEIKDLECITVFDRPEKNDIGDAEDEFYTIAELNDEWEDYKPTEPLIKDEKIREIIRLWAKVNSVVGLTYNVSENSLTDIFRNEITFNGWLGLKDGETYTITELCGEEEE